MLTEIHGKFGRNEGKENVECYHKYSTDYHNPPIA